MSQRGRRDEKLWEDVVLAMLSVNQYSLERTYLCVEGVRAVGLADIESLAGWNVSEIVERLKGAGLDRGSFMTRLFAERLHSLGKYVQQRGIAVSEGVIRSGDKEAIRTLLSPVNGVGPVVLKRLYLLLGLAERTQ